MDSLNSNLFDSNLGSSQFGDFDENPHQNEDRGIEDSIHNNGDRVNSGEGEKLKSDMFKEH